MPPAGVREIVTEAIHQAYIAQEGAPDHHKAAQNLIDLAAEASCGGCLPPFPPCSPVVDSKPVWAK